MDPYNSKSNESKENNINNGWVLCPSKSFPGKFYFFNGVTGEKAWSSNVAEIKNIKNASNIENVADKFHSYPEPNLPPPDLNNSSNCKVSQTMTVANVHLPNGPQPHTFGQITKPVANVHLPNIPQPYTFGQITKPVANVHFPNGPQPHTFGQITKPDAIVHLPSVPQPYTFGQTSKPVSNVHLPNIPQSQMFGQITKTVSNAHLPNIPKEQAFGQAVFPKYISDPDMSNLVWASIPMIVTPEVKKSTSDQVTQTRHLEQERVTLIHTCDQPLCKRFGKYQPPIIGVNEENKTMNGHMYIKFYDTSTPKKEISESEIKFGNLKRKVETKTDNIDGIKLLKVDSEIQNTTDFSLNVPSNNVRPFKHFTSQYHKSSENNYLKVFGNFESEKPNTMPYKEPAIKIFNPEINFTKEVKTFRINPFPESSAKNLIKKPLLQLKSKSGALSTPNCTPNTSLAYGQKDLPVNSHKDQPKPCKNQPTNLTMVDSQKVALNHEQNACDLESDDLRFLLVAKRRKIVDQPMNVVKNTNENTLGKTKKRVKFCLGDDHGNSNGVSPDDDNQVTTQNNLDAANQESISQVADEECWYLVADAKVLLENFEFIEEFVTRDEKCKLLIPHAIRWEIEATCLGDCGGRQNVLVARQLARLLASPPAHIVVQPTPTEETSGIFLADNIIHCCLEATDTHKYLVVLITSDPTLRTKAESKGLPTYQLHEIVDIPKNEITFPFKNINVQIHNDVHENLFLQNPNNCSLSSLERIVPIVDCFQTGLTDCSGREKRNTKDSTTSPIHFDDVSLNITPQINDGDTIESTSEIDRIIQNLKIKDSEPILRPITNKVVDVENIPEQKSKYQCENYRDYRVGKNNEEFVPIKKTFHVQNDKATSFQIQNEKAPLFQIQNEKAAVFQIQNEKANSFQIQNEKSSSFQNRNDLEEILKNANNTSYRIKDRAMEIKLTARMDEWMCTLTQIMEDSISELLLLQKPAPGYNLPPPWHMTKAIEILKDTFNQPTIRSITNKLSSLLSSYSEKDKLKSKEVIGANDFMAILKLATCLITTLKDIEPNSEGLIDAENSLKLLLNNIVNEPIECDKEVKTPVISRSEIVDIAEERRNFMKSKLDIIKYLKDHFPSWEEYDERTLSKAEAEKAVNRNQGTTVFRTCGKNVGDIKIDSLKTITVEDRKKPQNNSKAASHEIENIFDDLNITKHGNTFEDNKGLEGPKVIRTFQNFNLSNLKQKQCETKHPQSNLNFMKHANSSSQEPKIGPKVIINLTRIDAFEDKLRKAAELDFDKLDYELDVSISNISDEVLLGGREFEDNNTHTKKHGICDDKPTLNNDANLNKALSNDRSGSLTDTGCDIKYYECSPVNSLSLINDKLSQNNDSTTNDSGFESEKACSLIKTFLSELSFSFKKVYEFINESVVEIRNGLHEDKKLLLRNKTHEIHLRLAKIVYNLENIIQRESNASCTAKELLIKSGGYDNNDKRLTRYRQVITKCLEQAQLLLHGLDIMRAVTGDDCVALPLSQPDANTGVKFFNIFE